MANSWNFQEPEIIILTVIYLMALISPDKTDCAYLIITLIRVKYTAVWIFCYAAMYSYSLALLNYPTRMPLPSSSSLFFLPLVIHPQCSLLTKCLNQLMTFVPLMQCRHMRVINSNNKIQLLNTLLFAALTLSLKTVNWRREEKKIRNWTNITHLLLWKTISEFYS